MDAADAPTEPDGAAWHRLETQGPELAAAIRARFGANLHHVLGTIRSDGSPRLSGTEVTIGTGGDAQVTVGMMPRAHKLADVRRDPRVELHSAPLEHDLSSGDAKLSGVLVERGPAGEVDGTVFRLSIVRASLVRVEGDELVFSVWRPGGEPRELRRS